jgi:hypothetical protein
MLTLFTTPVVYLYLDRLANWTSSFSHEPEHDETAASLSSKAVSERQPRHRT